MNRPVCNHKQKGVSLIEALIALVVLSIGLLGVLILQTRGLMATQESIHRQDASILASDLFERIKANKAGVLNTSGSQYIANFTTTNLAIVATCSTTGCTDSQMAITDIVQWKSLLANNLPSAESILCYDASPNDGTGASSTGCTTQATGVPLIIKIWWNEKNNDGSTTKLRYTVAVNNIESM